MTIRHKRGTNLAGRGALSTVVVSILAIHLGTLYAAQAPKELHVIRRPSPHASIALTDTSQEDVGVLLGGPLAPLKKASFWLANNSDRPIVAIATKWSVASSDGTIKIKRFTADSFLVTDARPVVAAHSRLLVAPKLWVPEERLADYVASPYFANVQRAGLQRTAEEFERSGDVMVEVDSVIFSDGEVVGPNRMGFDAEITGRKAAARAVLAVLASAGQGGRDQRAALARIASSPILKSDRSSVWQHRFAQQFLHSPSIENTARYLEQLPSVPTFHGNVMNAPSLAGRQ